ncbi:MAG: hypothetical protein ACOCUI_04635 [bacterium]
MKISKDWKQWAMAFLVAIVSYSLYYFMDLNNDLPEFGVLIWILFTLFVVYGLITERSKEKRIKRKRERKLRELAFNHFDSRENFEKKIDGLISKAEKDKDYMEYIIKSLKKEKKRILKLMKNKGGKRK